MSQDGEIRVDKRHGKPVDIVDDLDSEAYYNAFASLLGDKKQSAVVGSYEEQKKLWSTPPKWTNEEFNTQLTLLLDKTIPT